MTDRGLKAAFLFVLTVLLAGVWPAIDAEASVFYDPRSNFTQPSGAEVPSPTYSSRYFGTSIDSIVMHTTEGSTSSALNWLQNPISQVSAHFVISPGGTIYQMVNVSEKAWHATYYNSRSIGIEMVGFANQQSTWNPNNLSALTDLLTWLIDTYDVPLEHPEGDAYDYANNIFNAPGIVYHSQVQPWNKGDPGPYFPLGRIMATLDTRLNPDPLVVGDYNGNGEVDAADYTVWADTFNTNVTPFEGADGNGDGVIDAADYTIWADNFGNSAAAAAAFPIPEPSSLALLGLGGLAMLSRFRPSA